MGGSSWAYTAGAHYQDPPVYGSLTFGGYDAARLDSGKMLNDIAFGTDLSRDLVVQLQAVTYDSIGSTPLLNESVSMFIDSMVSHLYLPVEVCENFERAFNLTWNSTTAMYLIDEDIHNALVRQNPTFTLTLGTGTSNASETVDIVLPYSAFDLNATQPLVPDGTARYFPLKQAQSPLQYTLGRVFLQEVYIIADYERRNFSISQAVFPSASEPQQLVAILPPGSTLKDKGSSVLSGGAIAGIVIGAVIVLSLILAVLFWRHCQQKQRLAVPSTLPGRDAKEDRLASTALLPRSELEDQATGRYEMDQINEFRPELGGESEAHEEEGVHDLGGARAHEMGTSEVAAVELEAPTES
ncbi:hypothetical protein LTR08_000889 [Meristemomyces frigidus]|nr:hypothetical protein LTR08_000889 [Meristemomyces frigidus]